MNGEGWGKRGRSCKIKVHVTLKDLGKSRQSFYVAFQYFLSGKEAKNSGHASASAFLTSKFTVAAGAGQVHLGNAFPAGPTALRPFLLKLGRSVPRFGETEFQRKVSAGVAVNAKLLRLFLRIHIVGLDVHIRRTLQCMIPKQLDFGGYTTGVCNDIFIISVVLHVYANFNWKISEYSLTKFYTGFKSELFRS